jgi:hypothetical protein
MGPIAVILTGGHIAPNSTLGDNDECRYAQKIPTKNIASVTINSI